MLDLSQISAFIAERRRGMGLTQQQAAEKLGVSFQSVSKWECGVAMPGVDMLLPLAELLDVTVDELLRGRSSGQTGMTYSRAGVNISSTDAIKTEMAKYVSHGHPRVLNQLGAFASLYDIHFPENCNQSISFVQEPVRVCQPVTVGYERTGEHTMMPVVEIQEGRIFSLNLWSLGAELSFRFEEASQNAEFGDLYAVMKDGKKILLKTSFKMPDFTTYKADTPIILEQVDHLELENGTIFPKP